jgi:hypothetical protein
MLPALLLEDVALQPSRRTYVSMGKPAPRSPHLFPHGRWEDVLTNCAGTWTDTQIDSANCGTCGTRCSAIETCCDGRCVSRQANCGGCGSAFACVPPQICCAREDGSLRCVDSSADPDNCNGCDQQCGFFPSVALGGIVGGCCVGGRCFVEHDFLTNSQHCGQCQNDCTTLGTGWHCSQGHCCPPCKVWFNGLPGSDWGKWGALAGTLLGGLTGGLAGHFLGGLLDEAVQPGCYACDDANKYLSAKFACCDGVNCTDLNTDRQNCSRCGTSCTGQVFNKICRNGKCTCPQNLPNECLAACVRFDSDPRNCGGCDRFCAADEVCCDGTCVNTRSDGRHCGGCGRHCVTVADFVEGGPVRHACCNGACIDVLSNAANCGACGNRCPTGRNCCSGSCVDTLTDGAHCGGCGGSCETLNGFVEGSFHACCHGTCVDILNDSGNCGACNRGCQNGESCFNGQCTTVN